jgi:prolipoprotein diacylglyceryltransferase
MRRVLFSWRGYDIHSYPVMLYVGMLCGIVAGNAAAHARGLDALHVFIATLVLIAPAFIGARLLYVATRWPLYREAPRRIWRRGEGGASLYGGLVLSLPIAWPLTRQLELPFGEFLDVATVTVLSMMIAVRIGCLLNGCCAGRAAMRWYCMHLPNHRGVRRKRFPTQLLEAAWAAFLLATAASLWPALPFPGSLFLLGLGGYAAGRLLIEPLRERSPGAGRFRTYVSLALLAAAIGASATLWPPAASNSTHSINDGTD